MERKLYTVAAELKDTIRVTISNILQKDKTICFAYIHGSFLDKSLPFHDIDLGVYFAGNNHIEMAQTALTLAVDLSKKTTFPVDVRVLNNAPPSFIYNAMKGEMICENNQEIRCKVMENTVRYYLDIQPILYRAMKEAFSS
ncbi:MAG: nucleotidyltransferase domain-containing protein [Proteobacteria bacterium]|nr:nucleotidyltransferase domain-containing protein [Pseudomonadota bacterium]